MKKILKLLFVIPTFFTLTLLIFSLFYIEQYGEYAPQNFDDQKSHHDVVKKKFKNPWIGYPFPPIARSKVHFFNELFFSKVKKRPDSPLPHQAFDKEKFLKGNELTAVWVGHSTILLRYKKWTILFDPIFTQYADPFDLWVNRFQEVPVKLSDLPPIDFIVISHDHYDHLDMETIKWFKEKKTHFITPLGVGSLIEGFGIPRKRVTTLDWWDEFKTEGLTFISSPAQHFSGRDLIHRNESLWSSWVLKFSDKTVYFSGDTGYNVHFKKIGEVFGPIDLAFIETGQYNLRWRGVHMMPADGVKAYKDLKAKAYFPIHWGAFVLSRHAWDDPIKKLFDFAKAGEINLISPRLGEVMTPLSYSTTKWWVNP